MKPEGHGRASSPILLLGCTVRMSLQGSGVDRDAGVADQLTFDQCPSIISISGAS